MRAKNEFKFIAEAYDTKLLAEKAVDGTLMCSKDCYFQKFEVLDKEFQGYMHTFLKKVDQYYKNCTKDPDNENTENN